jgi:hypothetical protein
MSDPTLPDQSRSDAVFVPFDVRSHLWHARLPPIRKVTAMSIRSAIEVAVGIALRATIPFALFCFALEFPTIIYDLQTICRTWIYALDVSFIALCGFLITYAVAPTRLFRRPK